MIVVVDAVCLLVVAGGLVLAFAGASRSGTDPGTYVRRIAGPMLAAFGLAIGAIFTAYSLA
jgi:hypothetical protein